LVVLQKKLNKMGLLEGLMLKNCLCFDVGANIGRKTEKFLTLGAKVVCVEPQLHCVSILNNKFNSNENVKIVNAALGEREDVLEIFISKSDTVSSMSKEFIEKTSQERFRGIFWDRTEKINVTTLDNLISTYGLPDYCKIDVEGYEVEVLKGLSNKINLISIEFTPELKEKTFECMRILGNIAEYEYNYSEGESDVFSFTEWVSSDNMIEHLRKNNDFKISFGDLYAKLKK